MSTKLNIGLALGSGSSRGWSHIGIINELSKLGINPGIVCGTSVGAMVGAAYVMGNIEKLETWACSLTKFDVARFLDINTSMTGFVNTERFHDYLNENIAGDEDVIEDLSKVYAAVSTDLETGREVWLKKGSLILAVWASMSMPGLFPAIRHDNRWLVDGGLVNPVPVSVCRALGADIVIAVNLNGDIVGKRFNKSVKKPETVNNGKEGLGGKILLSGKKQIFRNMQKLPGIRLVKQSSGIAAVPIYGDYNTAQIRPSWLRNIQILQIMNGGLR